MKPKSIKIALVLLCLAIPATLSGRPKHEIRLGVGDMLFETLIWHDQIHKSYLGTEAGFSNIEDKNYTYTPHFSAEYSFLILKWLSVGVTANFQKTSWTREYYDNMDKRTGVSDENFFNLAIMPVIRFNYVHRDHFEVYSSLAFGIDINGGSEVNGFGRKAAGAFGADLRLVGIRAGGGHFWGFVEIGALAGLQNSNIIYMLGSELARAGLSLKF